jgi:hypothetical protein
VKSAYTQRAACVASLHSAALRTPAAIGRDLRRVCKSRSDFDFAIASGFAKACRVLTRVVWYWFVALILSSAGFGCGPDHGVCHGNDCVCRKGEECQFACSAPPCHVACAGDNERCDGECANGECTCGRGSDCHFGCNAPPCHVACDARTSCSGTCADGECTCGSESSCVFDCKAGPCHVTCAEKSTCSGVCANGKCTCEAGSECDFRCLDGDCSAVCEAGAKCSLSCEEGTPGAQGCTFTTCSAGQQLCADGKTVTCGAECPKP